MNNYDQYGWYTSVDTGRAATAEPPDYSETTTPGDHRANWTGRRWVVVPYAEAPEPIQPAPLVPASITPRQGLIMLARAGLLASVRQALDLMDGQAGEEARIDFDHASEWRRDWPLLLAMAAQRGLTDTQVDQMFIEAATI